MRRENKKLSVEQLTDMKPEIIETRTLWEGSFLRSILITYRNARGNIIPWEAFQRIGVRGIVAVVPFTVTGDVLLIKQFRPPLGRYVVEFPAGLNDRDERLEDVARRELLEETGYRADTLTAVAEGPLSSGASTEILTVYFADNVVYTGKQTLDDVEEIEVISLPLDGFHKHLLSLQDDETYLDLKIPGMFELALREKAGDA
ncbi:MAG: NUDIX hydrolase [Nitrospirae bacterium]|nr:NUDIX hydrolase [Nitrospirota bacterium]